LKTLFKTRFGVTMRAYRRNHALKQGGPAHDSGNRNGSIQ
jgi:hypothetical protein